MDAQLIAHLSGELIILAGISVYFYRRNSALETRIQKLEKDNAEFINAIEYLNAQLAQLTRIVQGGGRLHSGHHTPKQVRTNPVVNTLKQTQKIVEMVEEETNDNNDSNDSNDTNDTTTTTFVTIDEENLDAELQEELTEMQEQRKLAEKGVTANCVNGVCKLE